MFKILQQARTIERTLAKAVLTLCDNTDELLEENLTCKIRGNNAIIISNSDPDLCDGLELPLEVITFTDGRPKLMCDNLVIHDTSGNILDWKTPLLKSMQVIANSLNGAS